MKPGLINALSSNTSILGLRPGHSDITRPNHDVAISPRGNIQPEIYSSNRNSIWNYSKDKTGKTTRGSHA